MKAGYFCETEVFTLKFDGVTPQKTTHNL